MDGIFSEYTVSAGRQRKGQQMNWLIGWCTPFARFQRNSFISFSGTLYFPALILLSNTKTVNLHLHFTAARRVADFSKHWYYGVAITSSYLFMAWAKLRHTNKYMQFCSFRHANKLSLENFYSSFLFSPLSRVTSHLQLDGIVWWNLIRLGGVSSSYSSFCRPVSSLE